MDISRFLAIAAVVLCLGVLSHQKPQEAVLAGTPSTLAQTPSTLVQTPSTIAEKPSTANVTDNVEDNVTTAPMAQNCTTAKGLKGTCIQRQSCDYSTFAIDLTLYAPRWYKRPCALDEVCCPFGSLVRVEPEPDYQEDTSNFDTNDNDNYFNDNNDDE